jgi:hypothetical protein
MSVAGARRFGKAIDDGDVAAGEACPRRGSGVSAAAPGSAISRILHGDGLRTRVLVDTWQEKKGLDRCISRDEWLAGATFEMHALRSRNWAETCLELDASAPGLAMHGQQ